MLHFERLLWKAGVVHIAGVDEGYATLEHQNAIRELGPCPIHRRSFDYIREICGQYCDWEAEMKAAAERLAEMECRKLQLMKNRLWKRISGSS